MQDSGTRTQSCLCSTHPHWRAVKATTQAARDQHLRTPKACQRVPFFPDLRAGLAPLRLASDLRVADAGDPTIGASGLRLPGQPIRLRKLCLMPCRACRGHGNTVEGTGSVEMYQCARGRIASRMHAANADSDERAVAGNWRRYRRSPNSDSAKEARAGIAARPNTSRISSTSSGAEHKTMIGCMAWFARSISVPPR